MKPEGVDWKKYIDGLEVKETLFFEFDLLAALYSADDNKLIMKQWVDEEQPNKYIFYDITAKNLTAYKKGKISLKQVWEQATFFYIADIHDREGITIHKNPKICRSISFLAKTIIPGDNSFYELTHDNICPIYIK